MQQLSKFLPILFSLLILVSTASAQDGILRGFVYDSETQEPVIYANIALEGTAYGGSTDVNGYFSLTQVPPGKYNLVVSYLGYETYTESVDVTATSMKAIKIFINKSSIDLEQVNISAERLEDKTKVKMSVAKLTPKEMSKIPTAGGEPDLAQVLTVQPGVIFTGDQGGQLYIRGGSPIQNKVLLGRNDCLQSFPFNWFILCIRYRHNAEC